MTTEKLDEKLVRYLMARLGCTHPFYISRILFLADSVSLNTRGKRITNLSYRGESFGFYIVELPDIIEKLEEEGCAIRDEKRGCIKYTCETPRLDREIRDLLEKVVEENRTLSPRELNHKALKDPNYTILVEEESPRG